MKTYTQDEVDALVAAEEQKGYDSGRKVGREQGVAEVVQMVLNKAAHRFTEHRDDEARALRQLATDIKQTAALKP